MQGHGEWDYFNPILIRIIMEQKLLLHGYQTGIKVNELDDEELFLRIIVLDHMLEKQQMEQNLASSMPM